LFFSSRKGTPIESPYKRRQNGKLHSSGSSHHLLSPFNTLDSKTTAKKELPLPPRKYENPLSRSYSATLPIKTDKLPGAFKTLTSSSGYLSFKNLLEKYPSDTFCTEKEALTSVTKNHVNVLSDSEDDKKPVKERADNFDDEFDIQSYYSKSDAKRPIESFFDSYVPDSPKRTGETIHKMDVPLTNFIKPRQFPTLLVSNVQYRSIMLPRSSKDDQNLKLIFVPNDRIISLLNDKNNNVTVPFSKISRVQFIRNENLASSDWYIDFVLNCNSLNFESFGIFSNFSTVEAVAFEDCNTLRINLANSCGLSIDSIEGLLIPILRDRNGFYFTKKRDPYGEFEKSSNSSSPKRRTPTKSTSSSTPTPTTKSTRVVPSLESLSSSDSVKLSSLAIKRSSNSIFQSKIYSPDLTVKRTSKRLRSSPQSSSKNCNEDAVYIDPNFESERVM
jgi:hypothetical protein